MTFCYNLNGLEDNELIHNCMNKRVNEKQLGVLGSFYLFVQVP